MPTKNSSPTSPPPRLETARRGRWGYLVANLAALPGLGSLAAGYRVGWAQVTLASIGFILTVWWAMGWILEWIRAGQMPLQLDRRFAIGLTGAALFMVAWLWSLRTGLAILRGSHESRPPTRPTS